MKNQNGFTIVEFLIAGALGLLVLGGAAEIYLSTKNTYNIESQLSLLQENGRYLEYILNKEIRMAGFEGCSNIESKPPTIIASPIPTDFAFNNDRVLYGFEGGSSLFSPVLPLWLTSHIASGTSIKMGTDVLVLTKENANTVHPTTNMSSSSDALIVPSISTLPPNSLALISDCTSTDIFTVTAGSTTTTLLHSQTNNTSAELSKAYQTDAQIGAVERMAYYIKDTGRTNAAGNKIYSLFQQNISGVEDELIEGVEEMKIRYHLDTDNDGAADTYQTASVVDAANNWSKVIGIQIINLLSSVEASAPKPVPYTFNGALVAPTDRLQRRQWTTYIRLRNRQ